MNTRSVLKGLAATSAGCSVLMWVAYAQPGPRRPNYDPATEVTVRAIVEEVNTVAGPGHWGGTHLKVKTPDGTFDVHVGPTFFVKDHDFSFGPEDQIQITGSKIQYHGTDTIIAREIEKDGKTLTLRNVQGIPEWSYGRGRRRTG